MDPYERALRREHLRDRLAALELGGSPSHAIRVTSPAVIEGRAARHACPHCGGENRVLAHTRPEPGLREVEVACRQCGVPRTLWFRLVDDESN